MVQQRRSEVRQMFDRSAGRGRLPQRQEPQLQVDFETYLSLAYVNATGLCRRHNKKGL